MLINLIAVITSQCAYISGHRVVHPKYNFYLSILLSKAGKNGKNNI